ncbi:MAG: hypothetical protein LLG04_13895 [Parachlamydia sp.]|nr:hypothetical protein [Parachlamydia sp.]
MRTAALAILFIGIVVLLIGLFHSLYETERVVEGVTGHSSHLMAYMIGFFVLLVGGALLLISSRNQKL